MFGIDPLVDLCFGTFIYLFLINGVSEKINYNKFLYEAALINYRFKHPVSRLTQVRAGSYPMHNPSRLHVTLLCIVVKKQNREYP